MRDFSRLTDGLEWFCGSAEVSVLLHALGVEGPTAELALLKRNLVILCKGDFVDLLDVGPADPLFLDDFDEIVRRFRTGASVFLGLFPLFNFPLLLAVLEVYSDGLGPVATPADVADDGAWHAQCIEASTLHFNGIGHSIPESHQLTFV